MENEPQPVVAVVGKAMDEPLAAAHVTPDARRYAATVYAGLVVVRQ